MLQFQIQEELAGLFRGFNYCENCEPREVIYTDEEFNNTVKGIKRKRQKSINTNPNKSKNSEKSEWYILFPLQVFLIPFVVILLIVASYRDDYNAKLRESKKGDFKVSLESYSPEVQAILKKSFEESKDK